MINRMLVGAQQLTNIVTNTSLIDKEEYHGY